jgi:hypothetical protein
MTKYFIAVDGSDSSAKAYGVANKLLTKEDDVTFVTVCAKGKNDEARGAARELLETWQKRAAEDGVRLVLCPFPFIDNDLLAFWPSSSKRRRYWLRALTRARPCAMLSRSTELISSSLERGAWAQSNGTTRSALW